MPDGELWFVIGLRVHGKRVFVADEKALEFARAALDQIRGRRVPDVAGLTLDGLKARLP